MNTTPISPERLTEIQALRDHVRKAMKITSSGVTSQSVADFLRVDTLLDEGDELQRELEARHEFYLRRDAELCEAFDDYQGKVRQALQGLFKLLPHSTDPLLPHVLEVDLPDAFHNAAQTLGLTLTLPA